MTTNQQGAKVAEPTLAMRLQTGTDGKPVMVERDGTRHYSVVLEVQNAPADTYVATFELDPTDYDPVRTLTPDAHGNIRLSTTTSGDYPVLVRISRSGGASTVLKESVARALRRGHEAEQSPAGEDRSAISQALNDIATH